MGPCPPSPPPIPSASAWLHHAIARIEADYQRSADTHLIPLPLPAFSAAGIDLYLKDESTHPTGSLEAPGWRSAVFVRAVQRLGARGPGHRRASSGSTAVSEAYFARLLACPLWR